MSSVPRLEGKEGAELMFRRTAEEFSGFESKFGGCTIVLEPLTKNTYVLIVANDPRVGE